MSPALMNEPSSTDFAPIFHSLAFCAISASNQDIISTLHAFALNKKSGFERESAAIAFQSLPAVLGAPSAPLLLPSLPILFDLYADKGEVVRIAAAAATKSILQLLPPEATRTVFRILEDILEKGKWQTKVGALDALKSFVATAKESLAMHDTKKEVASSAIKCATSLCNTLANADLTPHVPALVKCMSNPDTVPACIKALSSTTFVAEVTAPALAVLVPLLMRALNDRSMEVQRRTVVVIDNLVKLVRNPQVAARYLSPLVDGVKKIAEGAAFPEVRAFGETALNTLLKSGASSNETPRTRDLDAETADTYKTLLSLLPTNLVVVSAAEPNQPSAANHPLLALSLQFGASMVADLVYHRRLEDKPQWNRCIGVYMKPWFGEDGAAKFAERVRSHFHAVDQAKHASVQRESHEEGELLCDTLFSLAYGALLLLSHTTLRLFRGRRYGILGTNGSGKSTLLRQLRDGKVENFPPQDQLRCVMVEHSLQGEDTSLCVLDFVASDKALKDVPRSKIRDQLLAVGFDDARQAEVVGGLSGGWKMKLELARAMLYNADLLLLDELDRASVQWLEQWLIAQKNVTCLIVSHDSGFLDNVTTDIIHYETKKLVYYPGNLSSFVGNHPEARSYYTLEASTVKFAFPPPGSLMGVRSNTRAILKMSNCTYTYPGRLTPSLHNVSCALSLSSRVGIIGPNGAGKSTLIKLLTGESVAQEGTVYKHPALRVGYVSQHATHHIERHLEKTPIGYIQWRFQDGHDRTKPSRVLTDEEKAILDQEWVGKDGSKRKLELVLGRQKLKKSFQYEIKWRGLDHRYNTWVPRDQLLAKGYTKGAGTRDTRADFVRKHLEDIGLDGDIAQYNEISGLSGGQKIKLVIAACLWNNPQICVLDEPSNFLDREALGGLAVAIKNWTGAVVIISHNHEFVSSLCPEIWEIDAGRMTHRGKTAVIEDSLGDAKSPKGKDGAPSNPVKKKKKKLTRNQVKAQEERRRLRKLAWLTHGGPKPEDTDSDEDP
ncbi:P-loop containing nucleoside triphosphate hydrolase protein [Melanogaster broomeanus]|nr:P-loop containing nucleoside triphosphate hydrolase protein [Melanogaster broomeanus]